MITQEAISVPIIPHQKLTPKSVDEFLDVFEDLLSLDLERGMEMDFNNAFKEIEVGTRNSETCSDEIFIWFRKILEEVSKEVFKRDLKIVYNEKLKGNSSKVVHRDKYGILFNTIQIEINKTLRTKYFSKIVEILTRIIKDFYQEKN